MNQTNCRMILLGILLSCCTANTCIAQAQWEVNMVRSINPKYPYTHSWRVLSSTAKPAAVAVPFCVLVWSLIDNDPALERNAYEIAGSLAIAAAVTEGLKLMVTRPRPYEKYSFIYPGESDQGKSFPSGHVSLAFATATSLTLTTKKWWLAVPAFAWAGSVGYSRLYLGQHYPSDLIADAIVGTASAYAAHWLNKKVFKVKK